MPAPFRSTAASLLGAALLTACAVGPDYVRPTLSMPDAFKEAGPWKTAEPQAVDGRHAWWDAYGDPVLNDLMTKADAANQSLRLAEAQYREAKALVDSVRAGLFPTVGADTGAQRARATSGGRPAATYDLGLSASWEPDLWGSVRRDIESESASASASADDLAAARLSLQSALAQDYFQLRVTDEQRALYATTIEAYARALKLTQAQHAAGVALLSDVATAEAQLASAQAEATDLDATRATLEHAIAILTGAAPAQFSLPPLPTETHFAVAVPATPAGLPSALLERRPDIAAAERRVASANASIGVARAAYFPSLALSASGGFSAAALSNLLNTSSRVWSVGASLAETLFDGGKRRAQDDQAVAAYDAAVAQYKQTVLTGFQQVEDELATLRVLDQESTYQAQAVRAAQTAERLALSQYRAGTSTYLSVVTAQSTSLSNQRSAVQLRGRQLVASVALVVATGGGWSSADPIPAQAAVPVGPPAEGPPPSAPTTSSAASLPSVPSQKSAP